jgi:phospholipid-binding lipoprotein MlaA
VEKTTQRILVGRMLLLFALLTGCSTVPKLDPKAPPPLFDSADFLDKNARYPLHIYDPWEGLNRQVYKFNAVFDRYVFIPVVNGYRVVTPRFARTGVSNFFSNLREIRTFFNAVLQLKLATAVHTASRFVWNSTIGLAGFLDVATYMDLPQRNEDFGQTLGAWGLGQGPYLVLPILGPSSARDGAGLAVDWFADSSIRAAFVALETGRAWAYTGLYAIDARHRVAFRYHQTGSPFEYELVRLLYTKKRQFEVAR